MKKTIQAAAVVLLAASAAHAQQAVQWRVEDGGNGHWYRTSVSPIAISWYEARDRSLQAGGHLATLTSAAENAWAHARTLDAPGAWGAWNGGWEYGPWIGAYRNNAADSQWKWVSGEAWGFTAWHSSQPDASFQIVISFGGGGQSSATWGDTAPNEPVRSYVIEWSADCNNDGIVDYGQCRDGSLPDYNGNNTPDCCERGEACVVGNYPVQWRTEEGGNGHWFGVSPNPRSWDLALADANAVGGSLASIASTAENQFLVPINARANYCWIGLRKLPGLPWAWSDGSNTPFTSWCPGEPCCFDNGLYVFMHPNGCWDDHNQVETLHRGLIEWSADCNSDGIVDYGQILDGTFDDANRNGIPDRVCECLGDFDADGAITGADLGQMLAAWGASAPGAPADLNADGSIDGFDLAYLLAGWGQCQN